MDETRRLLRTHLRRREFKDKLLDTNEFIKFFLRMYPQKYPRASVARTAGFGEGGDAVEADVGFLPFLLTCVGDKPYAGPQVSGARRLRNDNHKFSLSVKR